MTEAPTEPPVTQTRVERRSAARKRRLPLVFLVVPVAAVAIAAVVLLVLRDGEGGGLIPIIGGEDRDETVPPFDFKVSPDVKVEATSEEADVEALAPAAEQVAAEVTPVLNDLYTAAFLDPANWREGDYEDMLARFDDGAASAARDSLETLTLGIGAGDLFERVTPEKSRLQFRVLFDPEGNPDTVVANVWFRALAERTDGTYLAIVSEGSFFLRDVDGWRIISFEVARDDRAAEAPSKQSPSASASPST